MAHPWVRGILVIALCSGLKLAVAAPQTPAVAPGASRLNNLGTAFMGQQQMDRAAARFTEAFQQDPHFAMAESNAGIAYFYMQNNERALGLLKAAIALDPRDPHPWYMLGLLYRAESQPLEALAAFRKVLEINPADPDTLYMEGSVLADGGDFPAAKAEFDKALKQSPTHASALFGLARVERRMGDVAASEASFARFKQVSADKLGALISHAYGDEGVYSRVEESMAEPTPVPAAIPVHYDLAARSGPMHATGGICLLPLDAHGLVEVVMAEGAQAVRVLRVGKSTPALQELDAPRVGLGVAGRGLACAAGDYDNDGKTDLAVAVVAPGGEARLLLFHNEGDGTFRDVTSTAGLRSVSPTSGLMFVDFDHDGDLDLFVTGGNGNTMWRNDGNGRFTDWTKPAGLAGSGRTTDAMLSDLNNDRAVDLITTGAASSPDLYLNRREGAFEHASLYRAALPPTTSVTVLDVNKDRWMDVLVTHAGGPGATLWRNDKGIGYTQIPLPLRDVASAASATAIDFDNDGWLDLALLVKTPEGKSELRVLRNVGPAGFVDVSRDLGLQGLDLKQAQKVVAGDLRRSGASDLLISETDGGVVLLANAGGNKHHALPLTLTGLADNKSAIGTKVDVSVDGLPQKFEVTSPAPLLIGLGDQSTADYVRLLWPTGVPQDEIGVAANKPLEIPELDRRGSSCPTLFAWNGQSYGFVADVIGAGVIGHWIAPGKHNIPDADEWIKINGAQVKETAGHVSLRFGEPMEEVNFLDQVRMVAVDHPARTAVYPQEGFRSEPPFATGKVIATSAARPLAGAWDDKGKDVLPLLSRADVSDRRYVRDFENLQFAGFANTHTLTLDLGDWTPNQPLLLLLHGFIEYFSASSMYAAWQAGLSPVPPFLEAELPDGSWTRVVDDMGFPAGLPRTVVVDLTGKLPAGTRRIRMTTNLQIYWDQALLDNEPTPAGEHRTELPLSSGRLSFRGYPKQLDGRTPGDLTYNYQQISNSGPFLPHRGRYTRYGDITPLLARVDDEFVIFGTGEDMDLEFATTSLPPLPRGWTRDYLFYANGYVKDMDFYEADPFEVGPLPFHAMSTYPYPAGEHYPNDAEHLAYELNYNTRFESGAATRPFQFDFGLAREQPELPGARGR